MNIYTFIQPLPSVAESNETLIAKKTIRVLDCASSLSESTACSNWNNSHCPQDNDYCNPFIPGDKIYFQYFSGRGVTLALMTIYNAATHEEIVTDYPYLTTEEGADENQVQYINYIIDTAQFENIDCFYAKIKIYTCKMTLADIIEFDTCVNDLIEQGKTENQAIEICMDGICDESKIQTSFSDPYCQIFCEQESLLIEGEFPKKDCNGHFYGSFTSGSETNSFKAQIRILGEVIPVDENIETTFITANKKKTTEIITTHKLKGHEKVPYYVIEKLKNIFASKKMTIDENEYNGSVKLSKNTDLGKMWIIEENLTTTCGVTDFSCS